MSVVVYDRNLGVMAADSRAYSGDTHPIGNKMKIHRLHDGSLLGMSSSQPGVPEAFKAWVERGCEWDDYGPSAPDIEAIHVKPDGSVFLYVDSYYPAGPLAGDVFTIGSGKKYALGAYRAGADVVQAVEVACACDSMCAGPVTALPLDPAALEAPVVEEKAVTVTEPDPQFMDTFDIGGFSTGATLTNVLPEEAPAASGETYDQALDFLAAEDA